MTVPTLDDIRPCLEGAIPAAMSTCGADGTPNVAYISQVFFVDTRHVALSFQFFNKTRGNILANPRATVLLLHPHTAAFYRLHIRYLRTETAGPLFEGMKAQLAGIASHTGMEGVFRLLGSDVYEVETLEAVDGDPLPAPTPRTGLLGAVRRCSEQLARTGALEDALHAVLRTLNDALGVRHAMVLMLVAGAGETRRIHDYANYAQLQHFASPALEGAAGYALADEQVELSAQSVVNRRAEGNASGSLCLELWALSEPYSGGSPRGEVRSILVLS